MWTFSEPYLVIAGFAMWTICMFGLIWTPKIGKLDQNYKCILIRGIRGGFFSAFAYLSISFLDTLFKILILGTMGYGNIGYQLLPIILAFVSAVIFLTAAVFSAPTKQSFVIFALAIGLYGNIYWSLMISSSAGYDGLTGFLPYLLGIQLILWVIVFLIRKGLKKEPWEEPPLWNISQKVKTIMTPKRIFLMWFLYLIELMATFEGYSFFAFGPGVQTYRQIFLDIGWIAIIIVWVLWDRRPVKPVKIINAQINKE